MSETLPVVYDRRRAAAHARTSGSDLPPGAIEPADAVHDPTRTPVVLVHGTNGKPAVDWFTLAPLATNAGLPVFSFSWPRVGPEPSDRPVTEVSADDLEALVDEVAARTGAAQVDLVGHSWGAVLARAVVRRPAAGRAWSVRHVVGLAPTYAGTTLHGLNRLADHPQAAGARRWMDANLPAWREQMTGSEVLTRLADPALDVHDADVAYTSIVTRFDQVLTPHRAAFEAEPRAAHVLVQDTCGTDFSDHVALPHDAVALWHVMRVLAPDHAGEVPRGLVLPFVGGPAARSTP